MAVLLRSGCCGNVGIDIGFDDLDDEVMYYLPFGRTEFRFSQGLSSCMRSLSALSIPTTISSSFVSLAVVERFIDSPFADKKEGGVVDTVHPSIHALRYRDSVCQTPRGLVADKCLMCRVRLRPASPKASPAPRDVGLRSFWMFSYLLFGVCHGPCRKPDAGNIEIDRIFMSVGR